MREMKRGRVEWRFCGMFCFVKFFFARFTVSCLPSISYLISFAYYMLTRHDSLMVYEDELGKDDEMAVFVGRVGCLRQGWGIVRMLDARSGKDVGATGLVWFEVE